MNSRSTHRQTLTHVKLIVCLCAGLFTTVLSPSIAAQKLSPTEAANYARAHTGGKVLRVKSPATVDGHYRVKVLLPKGQVRSIMVDGNNGKIKKRKKRSNKK